MDRGRLHMHTVTSRDEQLFPAFRRHPVSARGRSLLLGMSEEKLEHANALQAWLVRQGAEDKMATTAATTLFPKGFDLPSTLIGISSADLRDCGLPIAASQHLSNMLKDVAMPDMNEVPPREAKRSKLGFPFENLLPPLEIKPPDSPSEPHFVFNKDWWDVTTEIDARLGSEDDPSTGRVPPLAVVRCSRGGKTRALFEIANSIYENGYMNPHKGDRIRVAIIYVSFNDFSSIGPEEQNEPLQALCHRIIAFTASRDREPNENKTTSYKKFRSKNYTITPEDIEQWLKDTPALLLVDELNNLKELTVRDSRQATDLAGSSRKTS